VTEPGGVLLDRVQLERAFTALGERLVRRGVVADVFVVGGAAMALAYDATRVTRDVDSLFVPHGVVLEEAGNVAQDLGLPAWWLNEQASVYISGKDDPGRRRVFDHPGLRVTAASPRHIFALKALAARTRDVDDLRLLASIIEVDSAETALRICAEFFPTNRSLPGLPPSSWSSSADPGRPAGCLRSVLPGLVLRHLACSGRSRHVKCPGCGLPAGDRPAHLGEDVRIGLADLR
jgi:predicted nucleotidyltransferase